MKIALWINDLSIHILPFAQKMTDLGHNVKVFHEKGVLETRQSQGWSHNQISFPLELLLDKKHAISLCSSLPEYHHVFYGARSFPLVSAAYRIAQKNNFSIGLFMEKPDPRGVSGLLRKAKYCWLSKVSRYDYILTPGGRNYFIKCGFKKEKIHSFSYATFVHPIKNASVKNEVPVVAYIGILEERKNVMLLLASCKQIRSPYKLLIVGQGSLEGYLRSFCEKESIPAQFIDSTAHADIPEFLQKVDVFVLPSFHDGYGVVAVEAAICGCNTIVSDSCGVSEMSINVDTMRVFPNNSMSALTSMLNDVLERGSLDERQRLFNMEKAKKYTLPFLIEYWLNIIDAHRIETNKV